MPTNFIEESEIRKMLEQGEGRTYSRLGAHIIEQDGQRGAHFAVWAPNAREVHVIGDWNQWQKGAHPMTRSGESGIWACFIPGVAKGDHYKYYIRSEYDDFEVDKADPYAFFAELVPQTASRVWDLEYQWNDSAWIAERKQKNALDAPWCIYEVHPGSWKRPEGNEFYNYRELAPLLIQYMQQMGYTHVEFLPIMEHPFYGSWGYQTIGYYAPTSRYGTPQDLMFLIDQLHQAGIGVILDWVPSHFPQDGHGLCYFDGTWLYEHADPRKGVQPDWGTYIYNYGRPEVRTYLIDNALFWLDKYHVDGLRVDAVASMLYLDYSRKQGEWVPNKFGGRENLEAIDFIRRMNDRIHLEYPDAVTIAEESTAWPMVSRPTHLGGLGFNMKWNMGWMHDVLEYMQQDPIHRSYHHGKLTFGMMYAFSENFILPFSHDEVVHLKKSMISKMPGDAWQMLANLRLLFGFMIGHAGKKLVFMGAEFGQWHEWNHDKQLDWKLLEHPQHQKLQKWVADLNHFYRGTPSLYEVDYSWKGFEWIDCNDNVRSVLSFLRHGKDENESVCIVGNFTPVPRHGYRIGVPWGGFWEEVLNSDAESYGGSNLGNLGGVNAEDFPHHGRPCSLSLTLPPLAVVILKSKRSVTSSDHPAD